MIRLYFKKNIEKEPGFRQDKSETSPGWISCCFEGKRIFSGKEEERTFSLDLSYPEDSVPEALQKMIAEVSLRDRLPRKVFNRLCGRYREQDAVATVDLFTSSKDEKEIFELGIVGTNLDNVKALYYKIRAGQILPFENWETPQIKKTTKEKIGNILMYFLEKLSPK